ncbi:acyl-CoA dehydrogenase family protein [Chloroflexota bacterium]
MDFAFTEEQQRLREEVRDFYLNELPTDFDGEVHAADERIQAVYRQLQKKAADKGWLTAGWPKEYGGMGMGEIEQAIINEETGRWGILWPNLIGLTIAGPGLILFGTEEQKSKFIPPITRGDVVWLECLTEPNAGTDMANVQLRAIQDGDDYIFNGQKIFITGAYKADYLFTLAKTEDITPKHRGLSLFLIPADTPGITFRPLPCMGGVRTNEIFFDDVRIPKEYLLGELNRGFYHCMATFEYERSNTGASAHAFHNLEEFVQYCKETEIDGKPLFDDPQVRDALAQIAIEVEVWRLSSWRTAWRFSQREELGPLDFDIDGYWWKTFSMKHCEKMMETMGLYGQLQKGSKWSHLRGTLERRWQETRSVHGGGTLEMLKIVLAERTIGLPRRR